MNTQKLLHGTGVFFKKNSSTILTFIGAIGVIATSVAVANAVPKATKRIEDAKKEKGEDLTKMETVLAATPAYIPAATIGLSTIACIFGANALNKKQQASMASAYAVVDRTFKEYKGKLKELYGEEADVRIRQSIANDHRNEEVKAYAPGLYPALGAGEKCLFYEEYRGRYFEATMNEVLNAEYHLNRNFAMRGCASLNEFYSFLGLDEKDFGDVLGWNCGRLMEEWEMPWIDFNHRETELEGGIKCYLIEYEFEPEEGYDEY